VSFFKLLFIGFWVFMAGLLWAYPSPAQSQARTPRIPTEINGQLLIYEYGHLTCHMWINEDGMGKGAGALSCVRTRFDSPPSEFRIIKVIRSVGD